MTKPFGCAEVGSLRGAGDSLRHSPTDDAARGSHTSLRNEAAEMGANYIMLVGSDTMGTMVTARAFRCDPSKADPSNLSAGPGGSPGLEGRLRKLKALFDNGLITQDEYDRQRAVMLQSL